MSGSLAVVKIGSSSITSPSGELDDAALMKLADDLAKGRAEEHRIVLVMSGAIAAGMPALGLTTRPRDMGTLQAIAAVGQPLLLERMNGLLATHGVVVGQVLLTPYDLMHRSQYLHARETLRNLLDLGVLPIVNENDTVADDEIRYGDNDRLAALVSHLLGADVLLMLTDTAGVFTADPRHDGDASLIEEIIEVDAALELVAGGAGTDRGSGGMASKLAAAKIAAWSGVRAVIASASAPAVIVDALAGRAHPAASWWMPAPAARSSAAASHCFRPACARSRERSRPTRRSRSSTRPARCSRRGCAGMRRRRSMPTRAAAPPTSPTASPKRSSTATTSSYCPDDLDCAAVDCGRSRQGGAAVERTFVSVGLVQRRLLAMTVRRSITYRRLGMPLHAAMTKALPG